MKFSRWIWVTRIIFLLAAILFIYAINNQGTSAAAICFIIGSIIFIAGFVMTGVKLRCPHCDMRIPDTMVINFKKCPKCRGDLDTPPSRY